MDLRHAHILPPADLYAWEHFNASLQRSVLLAHVLNHSLLHVRVHRGFEGMCWDKPCITVLIQNSLKFIESLMLISVVFHFGLCSDWLQWHLCCSRSIKFQTVRFTKLLKQCRKVWYYPGCESSSRGFDQLFVELRTISQGTKMTRE